MQADLSFNLNNSLTNGSTLGQLTIAELQAYGLDDSYVLSAGYSSTDLRAAGYSASNLYSYGYSISDMQTAGYTSQQITTAGWSATQLKGAGYTASQLWSAGFSASSLLVAAYTAENVVQAGYSVSELKLVSISASDIYLYGSFTVADFVDGGFSATETIQSGFSVSALVEYGQFSVADFYSAGVAVSDLAPTHYSFVDLYSGGYPLSVFDGLYTFSVSNLRTIGNFSVTDIINLGTYSTSDIVGGGYPIADIVNAGFSLQDIVSSEAYSDTDLVGAGFSAVSLRTTAGLTAAFLVNSGNYSKSDVAEVGYTIQQLVDAGFSLTELHTLSGFTVAQVAPVAGLEPFIKYDMETPQESSSSVFDASFVGNGTLLNRTSPIVGSGDLSFNSTESMYVVSTSNPFYFTNAGFSFSAWFSLDSASPSNSVLFCMTDNNDQYRFSVGASSTNNLQIAVSRDNSTVNTVKSTLTPIQDEGWFHAVWSCSYSTDTSSSYQLYLNGSSVSTDVSVGVYPLFAVEYSKVFLGIQEDEQNRMIGRLGDICLYNRVLNSSEVVTLYNRQEISSSALLLRYQFGTTDVSGSDIVNNARFSVQDNIASSDISYNGVFDLSTYGSGTSLFNHINPKAGGDFFFQKDESVYLKNTSVYRKLSNGGLSVALWLRVNDNTPTDSILLQWSNADNTRAITLSNPSSTTLQFATSKNALHSCKKAVAIDRNAGWIHLVILCYNTADSAVYTAFVNGSSQTMTEVDNTETEYPNTDVFLTAFSLGASVSGSNRMIGSLADVHVFNRILTTSEIAQLYNKEKVSSLQGVFHYRGEYSDVVSSSVLNRALLENLRVKNLVNSSYDLLMDSAHLLSEVASATNHSSLLSSVSVPHRTLSASNITTMVTGRMTISFWAKTTGSDCVGTGVSPQLSGGAPFLELSDSSFNDIIRIGLDLQGTVSTFVGDLQHHILSSVGNTLVSYSERYNTGDGFGNAVPLSITQPQSMDRIVFASYFGTQPGLHLSTLSEGSWSTPVRFFVGSAFNAVMTADGSRLVHTDATGNIYVHTWNGSAYVNPDLQASFGSAAFEIDMSSDGSVLVGSGSGGAKICLWEGNKFSTPSVISATSSTQTDAVSLSKCAQFMSCYMTNSSGQNALHVLKWNGSAFQTHKSSTIANLHGSSPIQTCSFTSDGSCLLYSTSANKVYSVNWGKNISTTDNVFATEPSTEITLGFSLTNLRACFVGWDDRFYACSGTSPLALYVCDLTYNKADPSTGKGLRQRRSTGVDLLDNAWHHYVWTVDADGNDNLYIDNVLRDTATGTVLPTENQSLLLQMAKSPSTGLQFSGHIDDIRLLEFDVAATAVNVLYNKADLTGIDLLIEAGYSQSEIFSAGFTARQLWAYGYSASVFYGYSYAASDLFLQGANFTPDQLSSGGYSTSSIITAGFSAAVLRSFELTAAQLYSNGFTPQQLYQGNYSVIELRDASVPIATVFALGYTLSQLAAVYSVPEMRQYGGFSASQMQEEYNYSAAQLLSGGYSLSQVMDANYSVQNFYDAEVSASDMRTVGNYTVAQLQEAYSELDILGAGFGVTTLMYAGYLAANLVASSFYEGLQIKSVIPTIPVSAYNCRAEDIGEGVVKNNITNQYDLNLSDGNMITTEITSVLQNQACLFFNGNNSTAATTNVPPFTGDGFTVSMWIRPNNTSQGSTLWEVTDLAGNNGVRTMIHGNLLSTIITPSIPSLPVRVSQSQPELFVIMTTENSLVPLEDATTGLFAVSDSGNKIVYTDCQNGVGTIKCASISDGEVEALPHQNLNTSFGGTSSYVYSALVLSSDGNRVVVSAGEDINYRIILSSFNDPETGLFSSLQQAINSVERRYAALALDETGDRLVVGSTTLGTGLFWASWNGVCFDELVASSHAIAYCSAVALSRDGSTVVYRSGIAEGPGGNLYVAKWNSGFGTPVCTIADTFGVFRMTFCKNNTHVWFSNYDSSLTSSDEGLLGYSVWNTDANTLSVPTKIEYGRRRSIDFQQVFNETYNENDNPAPLLRHHFTTSSTQPRFYFATLAGEQQVIAFFDLTILPLQDNLSFASVDINTNTWNHLAFSATSTGEHKYYLNSTLVETKTGMHYPQYLDVSYTQLFFGISSQSDIFYHGAMSDIKWFNVAITDEQIATIYNKTVFLDPEIDNTLFTAGGYTTVAQLKNVGLTARQIRNSQLYTDSSVLTASFEAVFLRSAGFSALQLYNAGYSFSVMDDAGYTVADMRSAGYTDQNILAAGFSAKTLKDGGFTASDLFAANYTVAQLETAGFTVTEVVNGGFSNVDILSPSTNEYTTTDLLQEFTVQEVYDAGYTLRQLRDDGTASYSDIFAITSVSASDLCSAGFTIQELRSGGFSDSVILDAGFHARLLRMAGFSAVEVVSTNHYSEFLIMTAGFSATSLYLASISSDLLYNYHYSASQAKTGGYSVLQLQQGGYSQYDILRAGYTAAALRVTGGETYSAVDLYNTELYSVENLIDGGYSRSEVALSGYTASDLKGYSVSPFTASELLAANFSAGDLYGAGFAVSELSDAGYSPSQVINAGYSWSQLRLGGYTALQLNSMNTTYVGNLELGTTPALWLDSTDTTTLFSDTGGSSRITGNNQSVMRWNDKTNPNLCVYANVANSVKYYTNTVNIPSVYAPGNVVMRSNTTSISSSISGNVGASLFLVSHSNISGDACKAFSLESTISAAGTATSNKQRIVTFGNFESVYSAQINGYGERQVYSKDENLRSNVSLLSAIMPVSGNTLGFVNGDTMNTVSSYAISNWTFDVSQVVVFGGSFSPNFTGHISEVMLFNGTLSTENRQRVEGYLSNKHSLRAKLPINHPFIDYTGTSGRIPLADMLDAGYSYSQLAPTGYTATDLFDNGFPASALFDASYVLADVKYAGYTASAVRSGGYSDALILTAGYTSVQLKDAEFTAEELYNNSYTAQELVDANYSVAEIIPLGFTATSLRLTGMTISDLGTEYYTQSQIAAAGYTATELQTANYSISLLQDANYSTSNIVTAGYTAAQLLAASYSASTLRTIGNYSAGAMRAGGYTVSQLTTGGYSQNEITGAGYSASQLRTAGYSLAVIRGAGYTARQSRVAGYTLFEEQQVGYTSTEIVAAGYTASELYIGGYTSSFLRSAGGYSALQQKNAGFADEDILEAGYTASQLSNAGFTVGQLQEFGYNDTTDLVVALQSVTENAPEKVSIVSIQGRNKSADIVVSDPNEADGINVLGYKYNLNGGSFLWAPPFSAPITIFGLTNGAYYEVKLKAVNKGGESAQNDETMSVIPFGTPFMPIITYVEELNNQVNITFEDGNVNGSSITKHYYSVNSQTEFTEITEEILLNENRFVIEGLTNGTIYVIRMRSENAAGMSENSVPIECMPRGIPSKPVITNVVPGINRLTVHMLPVSSDGSPVLYYQYSLNGNEEDTFFTKTSASPFVINDIDTNVNYSIRIKAFNVYFSSEWSEPSDSAVPYQAPDAPTITEVVPLSQGVSINVENGSNNGAAITSYKYKYPELSEWTTWSSSLPIIVSGLVNTTTYLFYVKAVNAGGDSPSSTAASGTAGIPQKSVLTSIQTGNRQMILYFEQGNLNGGTVLNYSVIVNDKLYRVSGSGSPLLFQNSFINNGTLYSVQIATRTEFGLSAFSNTITSVVTASAPLKPQITNVVPRYQSTTKSCALLRYSGSNNGSAITKVQFDISGSGNFLDASGNTGDIMLYDLPINTNYTLRIQTQNAIGTSPISSVFFRTLRFSLGAPSTPVLSSVIMSFSTMTINLRTPVVLNGGPLVTYWYKVYPFGGDAADFSFVNGGNTLPIVVTGLDNNFQYNVQVVVQNTVANSPASTPRTVPAEFVYLTPLPPRVTLIESLPQGLYLEFTPSRERGASVTGYAYKLNNTGSYIPATVVSNTITITGLTNSTRYDVRLFANSEIGYSDNSLPVFGTPVYSVPSAPVIYSISTVPPSTIRVSFNVPAANGSPLLFYQYTLDNGNTYTYFSVDSTTLDIPDLNIGVVVYSVRVRALNALGSGPWSNIRTA